MVKTTIHSSRQPGQRLRQMRRRVVLARTLAITVVGGGLLMLTLWVGAGVVSLLAAGDSGAPLAALDMSQWSKAKSTETPRHIRVVEEQPMAYVPGRTADVLEQRKASYAALVLAWSQVKEQPQPTTQQPVAQQVESERAQAQPTFNGRPIRPVRTMRMRVTAYSPDKRSCGKWADGVTASGHSVWTNGMKLVAADTRLLPFGSLVSVPGYHGGQPVPVLDRGGKIKGKRLDLLYPTHAIARQWGVQHLNVTVWEYAD